MVSNLNFQFLLLVPNSENVYCEDNVSTTPSTEDQEGSDTTLALQGPPSQNCNSMSTAFQSGTMTNTSQKIKWKNVLSPSTSSSSPVYEK